MDDPAEDIMGATFRALCDHGYADLTMRDIAEESDRSKAALHYHYDDKEGLMLAFLDHLYEEFLDRVGGYGADVEDGEPVENPDEALREFVSAVLHPPHADDRREFRTALLEIKAQAPYQEAFRDRLQRFDETVVERVTALVRAGQDAGVYHDAVDPDHVAQFVLVILDGAGTRHVVAEAPVECAIGSLEDYLDAHLIADAGDDRDRDLTTGEPTADGGRQPAEEESR